MSRNELKPIGGYLELELPPRRRHYHKDALLLNSGRSCFAYSLISANAKKVYLPLYSCDSLIEPLIFHDIEYEFYFLDEEFEIVAPPRLGHREMLLYINYFGLKEDYIKLLVQNYQSALVVDNTQSFFSTSHTGVFTFYSPRKFFGVPDGGYLDRPSNSDESMLLDGEEEHSVGCSHLVGRIEHGAQAYFNEYQKNEENLTYSDIKKMSRFSERILASVDYDFVRAVREKNFEFIHGILGKHNQLNIHDISGPLCYPLWIRSEKLRQKLIENLIFVPIYWKEVLNRVGRDSLVENSFVEDILPLPVDQRYTYDDMQRITDVIRGNLINE